MREGWSSVAIGCVVRQVRRSVPVRAGVEYPLLGMRWYGEGPFLRETVTADSAKARVYFQVRAGDFLYNRLFAWKGSFGVVPERLAGSYVSGEFPVFQTVPELALNEYINLVMCRPVVWEQILRESTGSTATSRNRWNESRFVEWEIPLPPLAEQRRIVDLIAAVDAAGEAARRQVVAARLAYRRAAGDALNRVGGSTLALGAAVDLRMGRQRAPRFAAGPNMHPYLRAANVKDGRLQLDDVLSMDFNPSEQATFALLPGDVLVSEGCGSLAQLGASAVWNGELPGVVCFQNTLLRLRARPGLTDPGYVHHLARHAHAAGAWASIASGTNIFHIGSNRAELLPVPVPPVSEQVSIARMLDALDNTVTATDAEAGTLAGLRSAVVSDLLAGDHAIPDSYDRFIDSAA